MIRKDIQGLRAIAVVAVLLFHFWPERLTGGYVGVDVFFVISGFLITSHLIRKPPVTRQMLIDFWARRIKRLIPAATVVLFVTVIASIVWLPETQLQRTVYESAAAAVYGENWMLAASATDYLASEEAPSPIQHYWSLSIEEQYYALWPLVIGGVFLLSRRFLTSSKLLSIALGLIFTASLAYSIYLTDNNPAAAYFVTPTRVWELALGGIVALAITRVTVPARIAVLMAWMGLAMIATTVVFFTKQTPFPGYTALLPTIGTALVILAATDGMKWSPRRLLGWRPAQFIGDVSYSVYLWHWPVVVIAPFALGTEYLTLVQKLFFIALVILLSYITKIFIEDPVRHNRLLMKTNLRTYAYGMASILVVVGLSLGTAGAVYVQDEIARNRVQAAISNHEPCIGADVWRNPVCSSIVGEDLLMTPNLAKGDNGVTYDDNCRSTMIKNTICTYGKRGGNIKIALMGNSHAMHWQGVIDQISKDNKWELNTYFIARCFPVLHDMNFGTRSGSSNCMRWNEWARKSIVESDNEVVIMSSSSNIDLVGVNAQDQDNKKIDSYVETIKLFTDSGKKVFVIRDTPGGGGNAPDCIAVNDGVSECQNERGEVLVEDPLYEAARRMSSSSVESIDLTNRFCDETTCYVVIGGLIVYFDGGHITNTYARTLAPDIEPILKQLVEQ